MLHSERNGAMFGLSLRVGLRPGEAAGAHWDDLDGNVLHVRRAVRLVRNRAEVSDELKTEAARRSIELPDDMVAWLNEHRIQQEAELLEAPAWRISG